MKLDFGGRMIHVDGVAVGAGVLEVTALPPHQTIESIQAKIDANPKRWPTVDTKTPAVAGTDAVQPAQKAVDLKPLENAVKSLAARVEDLAGAVDKNTQNVSDALARLGELEGAVLGEGDDAKSAKPKK